MPRFQYSGQPVSHYQTKLGSQERRAGISLALIYAFRMFGLFLILPVFALYAEKLPDATPLLTGLAIGAYGLTQAIFQIPFGMLSDRIGRKPVIAAGLVIFALGSLLAASADNMYIIILGRALQGSGAIAAALMALAADLSREEHRTKMMALIGVSIGIAFASSMVLAPVLNHWIGVPGIFLVTAGLALAGLVILFLVVPTPLATSFHRDAELDTGSLARVLKTPDLLRLDAGIFILHFALMCSFLVLPLMLRDIAGLAALDHWKVYLPVFVASLVIMLPFIILGERKQQLRTVFLGGIAVLAMALYLLAMSATGFQLIAGLVGFFVAFNLLEASLPSLISKTAHASHKGTAMGVYSSGHWGVQGALYTALAAVLCWLLIAASMRRPRQLSTYLLSLGGNLGVSEADLIAVPGVVEAAIIAEEGIAYLKVERHILDEEKLLSFAGSK
jgi:predicted MFS family arabinose efflux permease